jgi:hypothetical protein
MNNKQISIISFIITLVISLIPIQKTMRYSHECPIDEPQLCYDEFPSHGFPFTIVQTDPWTSPINSIVWDPITIAIAILLFPINWAFYALCLKLFNFLYLFKIKGNGT